MSGDDRHDEKRVALRVALIAADPVRHARLKAILEEQGHAAVDHADADVILVDGDDFAAMEPPVVTLGGSETGQAGLIDVDATPTQITAALRAVAAGLTVRTAASSPAVFHALSEGENPLLTPREIEVLAAIAEGLSNKAIARRLCISQHTVKFHVESLFRKLAAVSRADAVRKGLKQQLLEL